MGKPTGPTSSTTREIINKLKKVSRDNKSAIWKDIAKRLSKPRRIRPVVNILKIDKYAEKGDHIIIPGKLLSLGTLTKPVTIAALNASESAIRKIEDAKGTFLTLPELAKKNPKGNNIKILA